MATPISVFICYKKELSQKKGRKIYEQKNTKAGILNRILGQDNGRFEPWTDELNLVAGMAWETEIYRRILEADVILALIGPGTSKSQWVRRELALATALGISIVPLGFDLEEPELRRELEALKIDSKYWKLTKNIEPHSRKALLSEIRPALLKAHEETKKQQQDTLRGLMTRRNAPPPKAPDKQRFASFALPQGGRKRNLHVASGDLAKVRNIDVLVNSENNYMQMARFFESGTVSSMLRRRGARVRRGKYEDAIQVELDWQLRDRGRPVQAAEVFATSTGGPETELSKVNKARYILHVAAVQAVDAKSTVIPYSEPHHIEGCVRASLSKLAEINQHQGRISPPGSEPRKEQDKLARQGAGIVRSMLFPLFGTGRGGIASSEVIGPMLEGISEFLEDSRNVKRVDALTDIYISVYKQEDLDDVLTLLQKKLEPSTRKS